VENLVFLFWKIIVGLIICLNILNVIILVRGRRPSVDTLAIFTIYFLIKCITNSVSYALALGGINNLFLLHLFTVFECTFLSYLFYKLLGYDKINFKIFYISISTLVCSVVFWYTFISEGQYQFNSNSSTISSCFIVVSILHYLVRRIGEPSGDEMVSRILDVLMYSIFINHITSFTILLFSNTLLDYPEVVQYCIWCFRSLVSLCVEFYVFRYLISKGL